MFLIPLSFCYLVTEGFRFLFAFSKFFDGDIKYLLYKSKHALGYLKLEHYLWLILTIIFLVHLFDSWFIIHLSKSGLLHILPLKIIVCLFMCVFVNVCLCNSIYVYVHVYVQVCVYICVETRG